VRDWAGATREIDRIEREQVLASMVPVLRAWVAYGRRDRDPAAALAAMTTGSLASYAVEHKALLDLALGRGDPAPFLALDVGSGLRPQRLRLAAAAEFAARGDRERALILAAGDQPAMAAARRLIEARRPLPGRIDSAAEGVAEFLCRVAIDFNQQQLGPEGVILARIAGYIGPDNSEPAMIAAELMAETRPAAAAALLEHVPPGDLFAPAAREVRLQLLAQSGQSAAALAEVTARTARGSAEASDWVQLGNLQSDAGRHAEAAQSFTRAYELWRARPDPSVHEWTLWLLRGGALERAGQWPAARTALQEAYRLAPNEPLVLNYLGFARLDRGEALEESEAMVRHALALSPGNAAITDSLGWALFRRGRVEEAIPVLERAVRGAPADVEINEHLGDAYWVAGQRVAARYAWRAAMVQADGEARTRIAAKVERGPPAPH
jgi:Flp pilus assembly protein TadD